MIWTALTLTLAATQAAPPAPAAAPPETTLVQGEPSRQALDLGIRVARSGSLAAIAPLLVERDVNEVVKGHPDWTPEDVALYRTTSRRVAEAGIARLVRALGRAYARRLSIADLERLATAFEGPVATRRRAIEAPALVEALQSVGVIDFKKDTLAAFCAQMGKGCASK